MPVIETVRPATDADVPALASLAAAGRAELAGERGGPVWAVREARRDPLPDSFTGDLADGDACVLVGALDGVVVGYGVARVEALADGTHLGVVTDLVVDALAREVGLGELLLGELVGWCASRQCVGVDALALPGARETKNFFEGNGFSARALILHRRLHRET